MERKWTDEQLAVIEHRGGNLLVSAAAGSGKTAVLIERIMGRILDETSPINIDELLVVTFTRDAAREMKERIGSAIAQKLEAEVNNDPDSQLARRLMKQSALLSEANMSTIDSFCKKVVMENFKEAEIDPAVRTMDDTEGVIIRKKVIEELLEEEYEKKDDDFINFVEYFARGKSDKVIEELILQLYRFSESLPDKESWFDKELTNKEGDFTGSDFENVLLEFCMEMLRELRREAETFVSLSLSPYGPSQYEEAGSADVALFNSLLQADSFSKLIQLAGEAGFGRLSSKKAADVDEEKKELAKNIRDAYKESFNKLREDFLSESVEDIEKSRLVTARVIRELIRLTRAFDEAYAAEKKKRNVVDISDWAHFALKVLTDCEGKPTEAAKVYSEQFAEIMIDEYQDSNLLQESILTSIAREEDGLSNIFMVGDVKQSIYKFRQAKPELFIEKYNRYSEGKNERRIDLHNNFRSGGEVIGSVNAVFEKTMIEELGGIVYDEAARLVKGRVDKEDALNITEVLIYDKDSEIPKELLKLSDIELEAHLVARRIKDLMKEKKEGEKELKFSDIAILLRTNVEWAESFRRVLISEGIPAVCESSTGYFSAWEVQVMLALLKILDNPHQDIPLGTVLLSPIGGFSEEELAKLRINANELEKEKADLWEVINLSEDDKCKKFIDWLNENRSKLVFTPVHELIKELFTESNFYSFVSAMPSGETRAANLDMLVAKAKAFEATSLHGTGHFVRYIDRLRKYEVDFGEAGVGGVDAVRILSIHKSKGLQYPVVFVSGMSKSMNNQDSRAAVVIHPELGIGIDDFNIETREKKSTIIKKMVARRLRLENVAEEIRLLYVAMTRAEDKLILTAGCDKVEERLGIWENDEQNFLSLSNTNSLLDFAMPALIKEKEKGRLKLTIKGAGELVDKSLDEMAEKEVVKNDISNLIENLPETENYDELSRLITREREYIYPYNEAVVLKSKMTVSELKRLHLEEEEGGETPFEGEIKTDFEAYIPEFMREENEKVEGAARGSLYHSILSRLDFGKSYDEASFKDYLESLVIDKKITEEEMESIVIKHFVNFFKSRLYERMSKAFLNDKLYRESPFVMGMDAGAGEVKEMVLVQGIIDAWFMEDDDVILMDYKTDRVYGDKGAKELIKRYKVQLDNYALALKRVTGKEPKERIIYSFSLGKEIEL